MRTFDRIDDQKDLMEEIQYAELLTKANSQGNYHRTNTSAFNIDLKELIKNNYNNGQ